MSEQETPLYRALAEDLRRDIATGRYRPGELLPTEPVVMDEHKVGRNTVRQAFAELQRLGLVTGGRARGGRRVQVRQILEFHASASESMARIDQRVSGPGAAVDTWVADCADQGHVGSHAPIGVEEVNAPEPIATLLGVPVGTALLVRRRLRLLDGEPHNTSDSWYRAEPFRATDVARPRDIKEGVISYMRRVLGIHQVRYRDMIEARPAEDDEIRRLRIPSGWPVIVHTRTGFTRTQAVRVTVTVWPADRSRLIFELPA